MHAAASAVMSRPAWRMRAAALALMLLPAVGWSQATIEIKPLPEAKHATVTPLGATELDAKDLAPWLDAEMAGVMQKGAVTGAVAVVVKDGQVVYAKGAGYADPDAKKPVDPDATLFRVGAMSSVITATAVMQLVEQHKLDLDADVNRYLDFSVPARDGKPVTLRDLLTYTSGFEDEVRNIYVTDPKEVTQNEDWIKAAHVPARIYPAGDVPAYSTYGMALAGYIVHRVSGQTFDDYVTRHIIAPLGMKHATFGQSSLPWGDIAVTAASRALEPHARLVLPAPALGLAISGGDMARVMIAQLQYGRAGDVQLLEQATVKSMQGFQRTALPPLPGMSLGLMRMESGAPPMLGHDGDFQGFHSLMVLLPEQHAGVFIATAGGDAGPMLRPLVARFAQRYFPPLPQLAQPTLGTARAHAAQLVGRYESSITAHDTVLALRERFRQTEISLGHDGALTTPMFGAATWREVQPYVWLDDATGRRLGATIRDGKVVMLSIDTLSPSQVYLPATGASPVTVADGLWAMLAVFALAALSWPLLALPGARHPSLVLPEHDLRWYRLSRLTAVLYLAFALGWYLLLPRLGLPGLGTRLFLLDLVGMLAALGTLAVAMETWRAWHGGAWWRRVGGVVLLVACVAAVVFMLQWHLLGLTRTY